MTDLAQQMTLADMMRQRQQMTHPVMPESRRTLADLMRGGLMGATTDLLGAPVDLATMMLRPLGYQHQKPVGGSNWLAEKLTRPTGSPTETGARMLSGVLTPGPAEFGLLAGMLAAVPKADDAGRAARMAEQGYTRGFWRGGKSVADGPFYTPDKSAAEDFAKRHGPGADVREYAVRLGRSLDFGKAYTPDEIKDIANVIRKNDPKFADELMQVPGDFGGGVPGPALYQILERFGDPVGVLRKAGFDTINAGQEVVTLHKKGLVRDAERAAFDPKRKFDPSPFAAVGGVSLLDRPEE